MAGHDVSSLHILSGDLWGGAETQMLYQLRALRAANTRASALFFNEGESSRRYREAGLDTHVIPESNGMIRLVTESLRITRSLHPKVIVAHGYKETFVARLVSMKTGIPIIPTIHGWSESYSGLKKIKIELYNKVHLAICQGAAARVITVTNALAKEIKLDRLRKLRVVYNVTDSVGLEEHPREAERDRLFARSVPAIVAVGRLAPVKQFSLAIQAIRAFREPASRPRAHLFIIGEGPERKTLEDDIRTGNCSEYVKLLGFRSDAEKYIAASDALLITSESEGLPTVLLEALISGTPVVSVALPGIQEIAEKYPRAGIRIVSNRSPEALAQALDDALRSARPSASEREALRQSFSPERAARELKDIYEEIISGR